MDTVSPNSRPHDIPTYVTWLAQQHEADISLRNETHYKSMLPRAQRELQESAFWIALTGKLPEYNQEYAIQTGYQLLASPMAELQTKSYQSFLLKTFRKNILENKDWPEPPRGGWYLPDNWYSRVNDLLRTMVVVKYLDGVEFLASKIRDLGGEHSLRCDVDFEARESGYYAAHLYVQREFEVPQFDWNTQTISLWTEIQITTQLQETILRLTHRLYEERRQLPQSPDAKWQWNYKSGEFAANYLGHILHYVEGMIMEIRDKQEEDTP
jgi:ppGpp synthetase/RelA/SpoT-type nucleotidyltranferase